MGLFSFLFGGGRDKPKPASAGKTTSIEKQLAALSVGQAAPVVAAGAPPIGIAQAKLRLKLAASLRAGQHATAYEAAQGLAEIQSKAGRPTCARIWAQQAERIRAAMAA